MYLKRSFNSIFTERAFRTHLGIFQFFLYPFPTSPSPHHGKIPTSQSTWLWSQSMAIMSGDWALGLVVAIIKAMCVCRRLVGQVLTGRYCLTCSRLMVLVSCEK